MSQDNPNEKRETNPEAELPDESNFFDEIDEGPGATPVDEIQAALFEASQAGMSADVDLDQLAKSAPDANFEAVDPVQRALLDAAQAGISPEVDFDTLPEPTVPQEPRKVITPRQRTATVPLEEAPPPATPDITPPPTPEAKIAAPQPKPVPDSPPLDPQTSVSDFWLILALFITFRVLALFLLRPGGFIRDWSDFDTFFGIAAMSDYGLYPFLNFWLEWPPLVPWLSVVAYQLALNLPPWGDDARLWFILIFGGVFLLFEIGNFYLIYRLARRLFDAPAPITRILWLYAGLFPPLYAMLGFFDSVSLFFILLALELILADRRVLSAVAVGIGFMVKIIPILMLPVALRRLWYQHRHSNREAWIEAGLYLVTFGLSVLVILAPFLWAGGDWLLASVRSMLGRSPWETIWAIVDGYYGFGVVAGNRLLAEETNFAVYQSQSSPWLTLLIFIFTVVIVALYIIVFVRRANYEQPHNLVAFAGLTIVFYLIYSKGYSPQFLVYLLPFILLLMPNGRGLTYALILTGLNVFEQPIYFVLLPQETWLLTIIIVARLVVHAVVGLEFAQIIWPPKAAQSLLARTRHYAPTVLGIAAIVALVLLLPLSVRAYALYQQNTPVGAFTGFMEVQAQASTERPRLLLSSQDTYRQIYPDLSDDFDLRLTDGASKEFTGAASIAQLLSGLNQVWILPTGLPQQAYNLTQAAANRGTVLGTYNFEEVGTATLYSFERNPLPFIAPARFIGGIDLLAHQLDIDGSGADVTLYWRATSPQNQGLTVFAQLLNSSGELVAGHDSIPRNGTAPVTTWPVNTVQVDTHRIGLPADLPPGEYTLQIGLYNSSQERIRSIDPTGSAHPNRAVVLEPVTLP